MNRTSEVRNMKGWMGLCLALILLATGCSMAPEVAFSPDGTRLAYTTSGRRGIEIRDVADPSRKRFYKVGPAVDMTWSPNGKYLVWADRGVIGMSDEESPPTISLLDANAGRVSKVATHFTGPFVWSRDGSSVMGFAFTNPGAVATGSNRTSPLESVRYEIGSGKAHRKMLGRVLPVAVFPGTNDVLLSSAKGNDLCLLQDGKLHSIGKAPKIGGSNPTLVDHDQALVVQSGDEGPATWNRAFSIDLKGNREPIALPPDLAHDYLRKRTIRRVNEISPDANWLLIWYRQDKSNIPVYPRGFALSHELTAKHPNEKKKAEFIRLMDQAKWIDSYELRSRTGNKSMMLASVSAKGFGGSEQSNWAWSSDNQHMAFTVVSDDLGEQVWLVDLKNWTKTRLSG